VAICLERGADCLHYGPGDTTVIPKPNHLLSHLNPDWFLPHDAMHLRY